MERKHLELLLDGGDETSSLALSALRADGSYVIYDGTASARLYAAVYTRRLRLTVRRGTETSDLARAVQRLDLYDGPVRLGRITSADQSWTFLLFLDEDSSTLVACTGVRRNQTGPTGPRSS
ncbi:hypothetical protein ABZ626_29840 [Streptomyces longispororuber]|uniref:hypothetical protein n=1 Tax=Streptomyces longispororuber TaxID=68230 RepID=UPI0033DDA753